MQRVRKAVIPAAGWGTRFLPATKAQPKEMLPIVDKPIIQFVVEEAVASGIEDIIIVTGWHKRSLEDHFDYPFELEKRLQESGKSKELEEVRAIAKMARFIYIRQKGGYGNGTPVLNAEHLIGDEPFAVLWADEFITADPPRLKQIIDVFDETGGATLSGMTVPPDVAHKYGIAKGSEVRPGLRKLDEIVEKPKPGREPSTLALLGGYVLTSNIFKHLRTLAPGRDNEIWLVDAINKLAREEPVYGLEIRNGTYYDCGSKLGWLRANIEYGLKHQETAEGLRAILKEHAQ
ncbi:MAG: UTP--glucose-1-phosphate uridylyltransferase [Candidatus Kerfeldbacteria bacterium]|nr:UTP--glucose-1-phosphate uridylyltransferase [Candidatus Kerfeldbacteria bacterium]